MRRLSRRFCVSLTACVLAIGCARSPESIGGPLQIALHPATGSAVPAYIAVAGLSSDELSKLRSQPRSDADWQSLLKITVGERASEELPPVIGAYKVTDQGITFTPRFPFDRGRPYRATLNAALLSRQEPQVSAVLSLPPAATEPTTIVDTIYPLSDVVPENLLRVYIEFSAPMGSSGAHDFVRLLDRTGPKEEVVDGAFLPVAADFWSPDHTRYTLFFDPGRVKQGILPNRRSGRPLKAGRKYALEISAGWPDGNGQPLKAPYVREFRAGPAVDEAIAMSDWRISAPEPGTRDRLLVTFARPLDHAVALRALGIEKQNQQAVRGDAVLEADDTRWAFVPSDPWVAASYNLVAGAYLEDPQGNQIGSAFEVVVDKPRDEQAPDAFRLPFTIPGGSPATATTNR